jgi:hypothetical protein
MGWSGLYLGLNVDGGIGEGHSDFGVAGVNFATIHNPPRGAIGAL